MKASLPRVPRRDCVSFLSSYWLQAHLFFVPHAIRRAISSRLADKSAPLRTATWPCGALRPAPATRPVPLIFLLGILCVPQHIRAAISSGLTALRAAGRPCGRCAAVLARTKNASRSRRRRGRQRECKRDQASTIRFPTYSICDLGNGPPSDGPQGRLPVAPNGAEAKRAGWPAPGV